MQEIWKSINGYDDYLISNLGNVKSLKKGRERILKPSFDSYGYYVVSLWDGNLRVTKKVHQLVAEAFLCHKPCGYKKVINHKNHVRNDNRVENLEITTQRDNANKKHLKSKSKYVGVHWHKKNKKWISKICINNKEIYLGSFFNEYDAHLAYQKKLKEIQV